MFRNGVTLLEELLVIAVIAVGAALVHRLVQRRFKPELLRRHNDVAGFLFSVVGVIYAVLLGFVVIVVWGKFDSAQANVTTEAAAVADLYRDLGALPEPLRTKGRAELRSYVTDMIQFEWPAMTQGRFSNAGRDDAERIAYSIERFRPANAGEQDVHQSAIQEMQRIFDARRVRLQQVEPSVPNVLWFALALGAAMVLGFAFMFGVENGGAQLVMTAGLAAVMAVLFVVIFEFDRPFRGDVGLDVSVWQSLAERLTHIS